MAQSRGTKSEYGIQLSEKQKIRSDYGLREKQFRSYFSKGKEPKKVFELLESRLDSIVFRSGLTSTRPQARQLVNHGHIKVNNKKASIPSFIVRTGDVISLKDGSKQIKLFDDYDQRMKKFDPPSWLELNTKNKEVKIKGKPDIKEQVQPFNFQMVLEFYSR